MFLNRFGVRASQLKAVFENGVSLSTYFPSGTQFYYGYPAGEDSGFLNKVTPSVEELVAARPNCCAGPDISVINFAATTSASINQKVIDLFNIPQVAKDRAIVLPSEIDLSVEGNHRNEAVKSALKKLITPGSLVMAQPYTDDDLADLYQIPAQTTAWLNDKSNMGSYVNADMMPKSFGIFANGSEFFKAHESMPVPVVVKASLSSSGDGVFLCDTEEDIKEAAHKFEHLEGKILVEQYIKTVTNYGVHFGVPSDKKMPIDIIGVNEQLTTPKGEFIGGIIRSAEIPKELIKAVTHLKNDILPKVRDMGWYGIGGFDVLVDDTGKAYFIDCNFRMTGMSAYHFMIANQKLKRPVAGFSGEFIGKSEDLIKKLSEYGGKDANGKFLQIITMSRHDDTWRFNGTISFKNDKELKEYASLLLFADVESQALRFLAD
ncbi:MAG: hypothetical protein JWO47_565 [Candidatus Saccharibacteria bacterium]|nr:hypothetical protein [Candidatus Saccharibacteria bacterium]